MAYRYLSAERIKPVELYWAIQDIYKTYGFTVADGVEEAAKVVAKEVVKRLKTAGTFKRGDSLRKGWTYKRQLVRGVGSIYVVHNKTDYSLVHLLEFGHARRGGGRNTTAFNFVAPIAADIEQMFRDAFVDYMAEHT